MTNHDDVRNQVIDWNVKFPYDRLWRKKYNIPYNSAVHREICFLDQIVDIEEDRFFEEILNTPEYVPNIGDWIKVPDVSEESFEDSIRGFREDFKHIEDDEH